MSSSRSQRSWRHLPPGVIALALTAMIGGCGDTENAALETDSVPPSTTATDPAKPVYEPDAGTPSPDLSDGDTSKAPATTTDEAAPGTSDEPAITPIKPTLDTTTPSETPKADDDSAAPPDESPKSDDDTSETTEKSDAPQS
jgi:hypothetical protein